MYRKLISSLQNLCQSYDWNVKKNDPPEVLTQKIRNFLMKKNYLANENKNLKVLIKRLKTQIYKNLGMGKTSTQTNISKSLVQTVSKSNRYSKKYFSPKIRQISFTKPKTKNKSKITSRFKELMQKKLSNINFDKNKEEESSDEEFDYRNFKKSRTVY